VVVVAEGEAPGQHREILDPIGVPVQHVAVQGDRAFHHLFDHLDIGAQLFALDEVDPNLAGSPLVDELGEHGIGAIDHRADGV